MNTTANKVLLMVMLLSPFSSAAGQMTTIDSWIDNFDVRGLLSKQSLSSNEIPFQVKARIDSSSWYGLYASTMLAHQLTFVDTNKFNLLQLHGQVGFKYQNDLGNAELRLGIYSGREYMFLKSATRLTTEDVGISGAIFGEIKVSDKLWLHSSIEPESWLDGLNVDLITGVQYQLLNTLRLGGVISIELRDMKFSDYQYGAGGSLKYLF